ncbi:MAG: thioredoxin family protein [Myxococcales bacterium]|nr:thioredoxin family protein [Myxococcales bacterium]
MPDDGRHPYFNDRRAVFWYLHLEDALAAATSEGKRVIVQWGNQKCGGSRALVEKNILKEEIAEFLNAHFVAVAADSTAPDPDVAALVASLPKHEPTPVCVYLAADGRLLHSTAGGRPAAVLLQDMTEATGRK